MSLVDGVSLERFYADLLYELGEHALRGGTAFGAAAVVKRVAREHGLGAADRLPLPRPSRKARERLAEGLSISDDV